MQAPTREQPLAARTPGASDCASLAIMRGATRPYLIAAVGILFLALGIFSNDEMDWARVLQLFVGVFLIGSALREFLISRRSG